MAKRKKVTICRTMFCDNCYKHGRPKKHDEFVVYGSTSKKPRGKRYIQGGLPGYTPHIISFTLPPIRVSGKIKIVHSCSVCESEYKYEDMNEKIVIKKSHEGFLDKKDFDALWFKWIRTGYEDC